MTPELTGVQHQRNKENLNIPIQRNKKLSKKSFYFWDLSQKHWLESNQQHIQMKMFIRFNANRITS